MSARFFVVVGAKGGVGATTIALQLITDIATDRPRAIVDADLSGKRIVGFSYDAIAPLDSARVGGTPALTTARGITLVELAGTNEDGLAITAASVKAVVEKLPEDSLVVVDAPQPFAAAIRPFIERAAQIVVVTEPTLIGVAAARSMLSALERIGIPVTRVTFVVNNARGVAELRRKSDIADVLQVRVVADLPPNGDRSYARAFAQLTAALSAAPDVEPLILRPATADAIEDRRGGHRENRRVSDAAAAPLESATARTPSNGHVPPHDGDSFSLEMEQLKIDLQSTLMQRIDFLSASRAHSDADKMTGLRRQIESISDEFLHSRRDVGSPTEVARIRREVIEEALGLGPLESLLNDPSITEIMVNGCASIYVERGGRIERTTKRFVDNQQVRLVIERIIAPLGRRIDESSPMVDARLPDGSRVNAIIEPVAIDGPTLTIRRFGTKRLGFDDLIAVGAVTAPVVDFLRACIAARLNCVVSGGTGSGKTTLLNALSSFIPSDDRVVTIEDAAELKLDQPHVVRLESRPANLEGKGAIAIRDLLKNSLRMRPDRIVVGECRGGETLDMLQAMNTGHDGSLTTVHANTARDAISRIETMVLMAGFDLPIRAIREQVAAAVDLIIQVSRLRDGSRRITSVSEVIGMEGDVVTMQELVRYNQRGIDDAGKVIGEFVPSGVQPQCMRRFEELGIPFDSTLFTGGVARAGATWL